VGSLWNSLEHVYTSLRNKDLERRLLLIFLTKHLEGNAYSQLWVYSIKKKKKRKKERRGGREWKTVVVKIKTTSLSSPRKK
jgi:hypothetical protein